AGLFDIPNTEPPVPALAPLADWTRVRILLDGEVLHAREGDVLRSARQLDMKRGLLASGWTHRTRAGIVASGREVRLLSQAERSLGMQFFQFAIDRDGVDIEVEASFALLAAGMEPSKLDADVGVWRTEATKRSVAMAGSAQLKLANGL